MSFIRKCVTWSAVAMTSACSAEMSDNPTEIDSTEQALHAEPESAEQAQVPDSDEQHAQALAELKAAVGRAPEDLNLDVDWTAVNEYSSSDLTTLAASIPSALEVVVEDGETSASEDSKVQTLAAANKGCKDGGATLYLQGGLTNSKLWRLKETVHFCWDYGKRTVTSIQTPEIEGYVYGPGKIEGWRYRGLTQGPTNTAHRDDYGIASYTSYVQASFELCPPRIACAVTVNPWIRVNTYRDGSVSATKGGEK